MSPTQAFGRNLLAYQTEQPTPALQYSRPTQPWQCTVRFAKQTSASCRVLHIAMEQNTQLNAFLYQAHLQNDT